MGEMIVVTDAKIVKTRNEVLTIATVDRQPAGRAFWTSQPDAMEMFSFHEEQIRGLTFRNHYGQDVCIGASKVVQEALGLPFKALEQQQHRIETQHQIIEDLGKKIDSFICEMECFQSMGFFRRLWWALFPRWMEE